MPTLVCSPRQFVRRTELLYATIFSITLYQLTLANCKKLTTISSLGLFSSYFSNCEGTNSHYKFHLHLLSHKMYIFNHYEVKLLKGISNSIGCQGDIDHSLSIHVILNRLVLTFTYTIK